MPRLFWFLLAIFLLFPGALTAQVPVKVTGVIKHFDAKIGIITVRAKGATEDESYSLLKNDIDVTTVAGEKTRLDVVAPGQTVLLKIGATGDVEAIVVQPAVFLATVADVDAKNRTIALARHEKQSVTMAVAPNATVMLAGRSVFLREIKTGSQMTVTASLDGKSVLGLNLVSDPDGKHANTLYPRVKSTRLPGSRWAGVLTDIDVANSEVHLSGPKTNNVPKAMRVAKDAIIQVIYWQVPVQELSLTQVVKMAPATVMVSAENQITRMLVTPPTARGKVKLLDGEEGRLTVEVNGIDRTFALRKGFKVMSGTRVMRLVDLRADLPVNLVLSLDREQLLAVDIRQILPQ